MLDGKAFKSLLSDDADPDLIPRLRDSAFLKAFAALADDLRTVVGQISAVKRCGPDGRFCPLRRGWEPLVRTYSTPQIARL
jgi:hypothetical protein